MYLQNDSFDKEAFISSHAALIGDSHALMSVAIEAIDQISALNMAFAMNALNDGTKHAYTVLEVEHPHEVFALHAEQFHPASALLSDYTAEIIAITNQASAQMTEILNAHFQEMGQKLERHSIEAAKKAPIAPEVAVEAVKEVAKASMAAYEKTFSAANQAVEIGKVQSKNVARTATKTAAKRKVASK